jgi:hypothetical protein
VNLSPETVILIVVAFMGNTVAVIVGAVLTYRFGRRAAQDASVAQQATFKAQQDAASAQTAALDAAKQLVEVAKTTAPLLEEISKTGKATHVLVNNDRSVALTRIAALTKLVARLLPNDTDAQTEAKAAQEEADRLPKPT